MFLSLEDPSGICLAGGFSALTHFPFPREPLSPSNSFLTHSPPLLLPQCSWGGLRVLRVWKEAPGRQGTGHRAHFREEETRAVFQVHTGLRTNSSCISAAPALNPPPRPFSQPKGQWRADTNNPMGSAQGYPALPLSPAEASKTQCVIRLMS